MSLRCDQCGAECAAAARSCDACGASLVVTCPLCPFENRLGDRFCGGCGVEFARLDGDLAADLDEAKRDELRTVTVMMADLDGFAALGESLGREGALAVMNQVHQRLAQRHIVDAFDGYIDKFLDGDIMALFGAPIAHEDAPERAVRAAVRMHAELRSLHDEGVIPAGTPLRLRIGLNTGLVRVGGVGAGGRIEYTAMGDTVNLAARLMTACAWSDTLISEPTWRRVARSFELAEREPVTVKGKREPQRIWSVLAEARRAARIEIASQEGMARLIGRDELLAELRAAYAAAAAGAGRVVGISGEAGIGKSRLVYELHQATDPAIFLEGRCLSYGEHLSFTPVRDVLATVCGVTDAQSAAERREQVESTVAALGLPADTAPPLGFLLGLEFDDAEFGRLEPREVRERLRESFVALLAALSRRQPLILFVDDLQWCDVDSLELFDHLVEQCADLSMLVVLAYRRDFVHDWDRRPHYVGLQPRRLDLDETRAMVGSLLQRRGHMLDDLRVDDSLAEACFHKSQGNPFFIDQTVSALLQRAEQTGRPTVDLRRGRLLIAVAELDDLVPDSVEEILLSRIDRLPAAPRTVLQAASVAMIGRWFRHSTLATVLDTAELDDDLALLQRRDLIREEPFDGGDRLFVFEHALARDVAYNALLRAERRRLHGLVGEYLERHFASSLEAYLDDLSHHFYHSDHADRAAVWLPQSAERAARRYSNQQAKLFYRRAIESLDRLAGAQPGDVARRKLVVLKGLTTVQSLTGDPELATSGEQRLALAREAEDREATVDASYMLARFYTEIGRFADAQAAYEEVRRGYVAAGQWDGARDAEMGLGQLCQLQGRARAALEHFAAATEIQVERLPFDPFGTWMQYNNLAAAHHELGGIAAAQEAIDRADQALAALDEGDPFRLRLQSYSAGNRGNALAALGRLRPALDEYAKTLADATATGERIVETEVRCRMGSVLLLTGELIAAREHLDEALELAREAGLTRWEVAARAGLAELSRLLGYADAAAAQLAPARELVEQAGDLAGAEELYAAEARLALDAGRPAAAAERLGDAHDLALRHDRELTRIGLLPELAAAALRLGRRDEARRLAEAAERAAAAEGLALVSAAAGRLLAELADDDEAALALLERGLELAAECEAVEAQLDQLGYRAALLLRWDPQGAGADLHAAERLLAAVEPCAGEGYVAAARARHLTALATP